MPGADLATLIDLTELGIIRVGEDRRIESANGPAHVLLDRAPGSLRSLTVTSAFIDSRIDAIVQSAYENGSGSGEVRLRPDAAVLVVRARRSSVRGVWMILEDVSELRRLQQIRTEFIDNLSHELRTPLTTVSLLAETLTREAVAAGDAIPPKMRDRIDKIEVETGHIVQMVNELLDLSRIESGRSLGRARPGRHAPSSRSRPSSACACSRTARGWPSASRRRTTCRRSAATRTASGRSS